jgi:hypothetical protein
VNATVYQQLVGSLMYLVNTRLDICYAVNQLSQEMVEPTKIFWKASKHVLRYPVMSPLWDIITGQRFMMTRVARWVLERVQGYLRGIVGSNLH